MSRDSEIGVIPIHPKYSERIFAGSKKFEFRKRNFRTSVNCFLLYETAPVSHITGYVVKEDVISGSPEFLWKMCEKYAGISRKNFDRYFLGAEQGFALQLGSYFQYSHRITINIPPPQSVRYITYDQFCDMVERDAGGKLYTTK